MGKLKLGSKGKEVEQLQSKLKELGFFGSTIDGVFGPVTDLAVKAFQKKNNLIDDGIVGAKTFALLDSHVQNSEVLDTSALKPPKNYQEIYEKFGDPLQSGWESVNLAFCEVPASFKCFSLVRGKRGFYCHKKLVGQFQKVFNEIEAKGLTKEVYSFDGCWNVRKIRGGTKLSLHSWAIAIDINYEGNELGNQNPKMPKSLINIFAKYNFYWGGNFSRCDGMHFEYFGR